VNRAVCVLFLTITIAASAWALRSTRRPPGTARLAQPESEASAEVARAAAPRAPTIARPPPPTVPSAPADDDEEDDGPEMATGLDGVVVDADGQPVTGAVVAIRDSDHELAAAPETEEDGRFSAGLEPGRYYVAVHTPSGDGDAMELAIDENERLHGLVLSAPAGRAPGRTIDRPEPPPRRVRMVDPTFDIVFD
jgi:hypothetical protein